MIVGEEGKTVPQVTVNNLEVRRANRNRIYQYISRKEQVSKQEIAHALHMSLPTVTQNLKDLMEQELVEEAGMLESTGGRKAAAYSCRFRARAAIGVDLTKNHISAVVVDLKGTVLSHKRIRCAFSKTEAYFHRLGQLVEQVIGCAGVSSSQILGVGIAVPAIVSQDHQTMSYSPALGETSCRLSDFEQALPYPCFLYNDANAAGFAETWNHSQIGNVAYLSLNFTVGGAILIDGKVYGGDDRRSAEFGHMTIVPEGELCYCGQRGCADAYLSAQRLAECADGSVALFFDKLKAGDEHCREVWDQYVKALVLTVNNLRMIFDCSVILGGYVGSYADDFLAEVVEAAAQKNTFERDGGYLRACSYRLEATAVGAGLQFVERFIKQI